MHDSAINVLERALLKNPGHPRLKVKLAASRRAAASIGPRDVDSGYNRGASPVIAID
jgi:hypothetical protein